MGREHDHNKHRHDHCEPPKRHNPVWCGEVDTTKPGDHYDTQYPVKPHRHCDLSGYKLPERKCFAPGISLERQILELQNDYNGLLDIWKCLDEKTWGAYDQLVDSTMYNDAYYTEITTTSGYSEAASAAFKVIKIPYLDRCGEPILFELGLAYNDTTNSLVKEDMFHASEDKLADKLIPALNTDGTGWKGKVYWKGAPLNVDPGIALGYSFGVTKRGMFKWYHNAAPESQLRQDGVYNAAGCLGVLIVDKTISTDKFPEDATELKARIGVGQNQSTKDRFIIVVDGTTDTGCTSQVLAELFTRYGCHMAVEVANGSTGSGMDKGEFMFMPPTVESRNISLSPRMVPYIEPSVPEMYAYWYITKRRHYRNQYVSDVALLIQKVGQIIWRETISNGNLDFLKSEVNDLNNRLAREIADRIAGDEALGVIIDKEISDREDADADLLAKINQEIADRINGDETLNTRITNEVKLLNDRITDEVTALEEADEELRVYIDQQVSTLNSKDVASVDLSQDGTKNTYRVKLNDGTYILVGIETYDYNMLVSKLQSLSEVEANLEAEIQARKDGDDALRALIVAEEQARIAGDASLTQLISTLRADYEAYVFTNDADIETIKNQIAAIRLDITAINGYISDLQTIVAQHTDQMAALNATVTALQSAFASLETSFESVKQTVADMQIELNAFELRIENEINNEITLIKQELDDIVAMFNLYLKLSGGKMSGAIDVDGNDILNVEFTNPFNEGVV